MKRQRKAGTVTIQALLEEMDDRMNDYQYELIKENSSKLLKTIDSVEKTVDMLSTKTSRVLRPISPRYKNRKNRQINPVRRKYESL